MALILSVLLVPLLTIGIAIYAWRKHLGPARVLEQLGPPPLPASAPVVIVDHTPRENIAVGLLHKLGRFVPSSAQETQSCGNLLTAAGFRSDSAVEIFLGFRVFSALSLLVFMFLIRNSLGDNPVLRVVLIGFSAFAGYTLPSMVLGRLIKRRKLKLRLALADALDLLVVCVEAGLGLDQSLQNVSAELASTHKELCEEFGMMMMEMRAGKRRMEALKSLAERTQEPELGRLVTTLTQSDRFGTSMGEALRSHSEFLRVRRRQEAEERAAKVGVKLVFPIFVFILPSMLVVSIGPGLLQLIQGLMPMLKGFKT
jgi:tight adherence protein C